MFDIAIIGCGPAGMSASIYARRFNRSVIIFEYNSPGGMVVNTEVINNYPGFDSISGVDLAMNMYSQMSKLKVTYKQEKVDSIEKSELGFLINNKHLAKTVIIATGTTHKVLGAINEEKFFYKGISWCAICDGPLYKDLEVCVVGGGNSAISMALTLANFCSKVYLIHRRNQFRCEEVLLNEARNNQKIIFYTNKKIIEFQGEELLESVVLSDTETNETTLLNIKACFEAVGTEPSRIDIPGLETDSFGYILTDKNMETSVKGIYACGDIVSKSVRQIATATSDGVIAAIAINESLK